MKRRIEPLPPPVFDHRVIRFPLGTLGTQVYFEISLRCNNLPPAGSLPRGQTVRIFVRPRCGVSQGVRVARPVEPAVKPPCVVWPVREHKGSREINSLADTRARAHTGRARCGGPRTRARTVATRFIIEWPPSRAANQLGNWFIIISLCFHYPG